MYEELWEKEGVERLAAIDELSIVELSEICHRTKKCLRCPLAILYQDNADRERLLCVDVATRRRVENALKYGGRFVRKGEKF